MKKGAISILVIISIIWSGCSFISFIEKPSNNSTQEMIKGKDYGQNLNPLDSLRKKFI